MLGKLISKEEVAKGTLHIVFETEQPVSFKPGQYFFVNLPIGKKQFSINNTPNQNILSLTTRLTGSDFKNALNSLPIGSEIELGPIAGVFTLPETQDKPFVFIAGGIGITPFRSMLAYIKEQNLPYKVTLLYSNRDKSSTAYLEDLQNFAKENPNFKLILTMTEDPTWTGEKRLVNSVFIKEYFPNVNDQRYFVVGPPGMVEAVEKSLKEAGVIEENIKEENFTGY